MVAWVVNKCKYYLLGMQDWQLKVDNIPLIPILSPKELLLIPSPRITDRRVKLLLYGFILVDRAGKTNVVPDILSLSKPDDADPNP